jgi:hypothetical protein
MIRQAIALTMIASFAAVCRASAQQIHGVVRDSASAQPVSGAVLTLLDATGGVLGRGISDERGSYRLSTPSGGSVVASMRVVRIGFRPRVILAPALSARADIDIVIASLATMLEPVRVIDQPNCPRRNDRAAAFALWEQAKSGLLATVVARQENPAALLRLAFQRKMDDDGHIIGQTVRIDSTDRTAASFQAVHNATDFVANGFRDTQGASDVFLAPDAEVLLDERFVNGYCLRIADRDRARPNEIGLAFTAATHKRDRVDIEGVIWIDTTVRALRRVDYSYVGLSRRVEDLHPGGHLEFREMPNGLVLVDRWNIRLVTAESTDVVVPAKMRSDDITTARYILSPQESGGEVARAAWANGSAWQGSLGTLRVHAITRAGAPSAGTRVRLEDTDYGATADASGNFEISNLIPGPYSLVVADPRLTPIRLTIPTKTSFVAARDSTRVATIVVPTAEEFVADRCVADRKFAAKDTTAWLLIRVMKPDATPIAGLKVTLAQRIDPSEREARDAHDTVNEWTPVPDSYETGTDGLFALCRNVTRGWHLRIRVRDQRGATAEMEIRVMDKLTVVPFVLVAQH